MENTVSCPQDVPVSVQLSLSDSDRKMQRFRLLDGGLSRQRAKREEVEQWFEVK